RLARVNKRNRARQVAHKKSQKCKVFGLNPLARYASLTGLGDVKLMATLFASGNAGAQMLRFGDKFRRHVFRQEPPAGRKRWQ
ncbi:MAG: hypothetical protein V3V65_04845, partial [Hyphomicrobium sp.]